MQWLPYRVTTLLRFHCTKYIYVPSLCMCFVHLSSVSIKITRSPDLDIRAVGKRYYLVGNGKKTAFFLLANT